MWSRVVSEPALTCKGEQEPLEKEKIFQFWSSVATLGMPHSPLVKSICDSLDRNMNGSVSRKVNVSGFGGAPPVLHEEEQIAALLLLCCPSMAPPPPLLVY